MTGLGREKIVVATLALGLAAAVAFSFVPGPVTAQQPTVQRKVLLTQDLAAIPGYQMVMVSVEIPPGGREGRHTHPGALTGYVQEGILTLDDEGKATMTYKPGDSFFVKGGNIHEGSNIGTSSVKLLATFVVEKGKPLTTPVQ
jgi:quercetin dioxygenase-like cupin family protein